MLDKQHVRQQPMLVRWIVIDLLGTALATTGFYKAVTVESQLLAGITPIVLISIGGGLILLSLVQIIRLRMSILRTGKTDD